MTLKSSVFGLRGVLMTLLAALSIGVSGPSVKAAPADSVVYAYQATIEVISNQYYTTMSLLQLQMAAEVQAGAAQGKSFLELHKIVDKYEKKFAKNIKTARKGVVKAQKRALKDLQAFGSPYSHVSYIVSNSQGALNYLNVSQAQLGAALDQWLIQMLL